MSGFNKYYRGALTILFFITCLALLSYLKPPAWIWADRVGVTYTPERVINVTRSELEQFPALLEAIQISENTHLFGAVPHWANCSYSEGMKIVKHFEAQLKRNYYQILLNVDEQLYMVSIEFAHKPLPRA